MTPYHVAPEDLHDWVRGASGSIASVSVEQHVASCQACQSDVTTLVASTPVEAVPDLTDLWSRVRDDIELAPASPVERLLTTWAACLRTPRSWPRPRPCVSRG